MGRRLTHGPGAILALAIVSTAGPTLQARVIRGPAPRKPDVRGIARRRFHPFAPQPPRAPAAIEKVSGIDLVAPAAGDAPSFRITRPDGSTPAGLSDGWSAFVEEADPAGSAQTDRQAHEHLTLPPDSYTVAFMSPLPATTDGENSAEYVWTQPVRVRAGRLAPVDIQRPNLPPGAIAHVRLRISGPTSKFNALTLEPDASRSERERGTSEWEYLAPPGPWPDEIPLALLKGRYRVTLSAALGPFATFRYELPGLVDVTGSGPVALAVAPFHHLVARIADRKGRPLIGVPLVLHGPGQTVIYLDSGAGSVSAWLPAARYQVHALVWGEKGQRDVVIDRDLSMDGDRSPSWRAPSPAIDFFGSLARP